VEKIYYPELLDILEKWWQVCVGITSFLFLAYEFFVHLKIFVPLTYYVINANILCLLHSLYKYLNSAQLILPSF
jgi:hypothetical protein